MNYRIMTQSLQARQAANPPAPTVDDYLGRLIKYIPPEVIGAWLAIRNLVLAYFATPPRPPAALVILWTCFVLMLVFSAAWTYKKTSKPGLPPAWLQIAISTGSFAVWAWALGEPFNWVIPYSALLSGIVLIFYTLFTAMVVPE